MPQLGRVRNTMRKAPMKIRAARSMLVLYILAACSFVHSQELLKHGDSPHPKLGLVLEGGGALGLAHIGVITWMEEHRIPVSYVTGTSMGGLVGGIYATGRSPAEVRELINGIDWDQVLSGVTPFRDLSFDAKKTPTKSPVSLNLVCATDCSSPQDLTLDRKSISSSIASHFPTQRLQASTISRYRSPAWLPILSPASGTSSAMALLHWP